MEKTVDIIRNIQDKYLDQTLERSKFGYCRNSRVFYSDYMEKVYNILAKEYNVDFETAKRIVAYAKENNISLKSNLVKRIVRKHYNITTFLNKKKGVCKQFAQTFILCANVDVVRKELRQHNPYTLGIYDGKSISENGKSDTYVVPFIRIDGRELIIDPTMGSDFAYSKELFFMSTPTTYDFNFKKHRKSEFVKTAETVFKKDLTLEDMYEVMSDRMTEGEHAGYTKTLLER